MSCCSGHTGASNPNLWPGRSWGASSIEICFVYLYMCGKLLFIYQHVSFLDYIGDNLLRTRCSLHRMVSWVVVIDCTSVALSNRQRTPSPEYWTSFPISPVPRSDYCSRCIHLSPPYKLTQNHNSLRSLVLPWLTFLSVISTLIAVLFTDPCLFTVSHLLSAACLDPSLLVFLIRDCLLQACLQFIELCLSDYFSIKYCKWICTSLLLLHSCRVYKDGE